MYDINSIPLTMASILDTNDRHFGFKMAAKIKKIYKKHTKNS